MLIALLGSFRTPTTVSAPATMSEPSLAGGTEEATLTLATPAPNDGGDAITSYGYEVTSSADTGFAFPVASGTQTPGNLGNPINISPLTADDYIARSRATNSIGSGPWSAASAVATVAAAGTPSITANLVDSTLEVDSSTAGDLYLTLVPDVEATPSEAQIIAGQKSDGSPAPFTYTAAITTGDQTLSPDLTSVSDGIQELCILVQDGGGTNSNVVVIVETLLEEGFLLDVYPSSGPAWSLLKRKSTTTSVVRVRRGTDDVEMDFTAAEVSDGTLTTWVGAGNDGFVHTSYDQNGTNHRRQLINSRQPKIVNAGALVTLGGQPAMSSDGVNDCLIADRVLSANEWHIFVAANCSSMNSGDVMMSQHLSGTTGRINFLQYNGSVSAAVVNDTGGTTQVGNSTFDSTGDAVYESAAFADDYYIGKNNAALEEVLTAVANTPANLDFVTGAANEGTSNQANMVEGEMIVYTTEQTANRAAINADIAGKYGITI